MLLVLFSHLFLLKAIYIYISLFLSVYPGASRFPLLEIQLMDSHRSNSAPVTEEREECFLLKINAQKGRLSRSFLPFIASLKGSTSHRPFPSRHRQLRDAALLPVDPAGFAASRGGTMPPLPSLSPSVVPDIVEGLPPVGLVEFLG